MRRSAALPLVVVPLLTLALSGCAEEGITSTTIRKRIAVKNLPEPILKAAQDRLRDTQIEDAFENRENGKTLQSYEIRGRTKVGKVREVRVSLTGKILEEE
ncbi:MAG: hypothetical protein P4L84_13815 [Isosphaeraceae bacterium]|nr:hypothetical protein [Isosphaeraceae bacterium]